MFPHLWKKILAQHYDYSAQMLWVERTVNKTCLRPRKWPTYTDMLCCAFNPFHPLASDFNSSVRTWLAFSFFPEQVWGGGKKKKNVTHRHFGQNIFLIDSPYFTISARSFLWWRPPSHRRTALPHSAITSFVSISCQAWLLDSPSV